MDVYKDGRRHEQFVDRMSKKVKYSQDHNEVMEIQPPVQGGNKANEAPNWGGSRASDTGNGWGGNNNTGDS